jgi:formylglycine-generating enzyme required for sulfatase activity
MRGKTNKLGSGLRLLALASCCLPSLVVAQTAAEPRYDPLPRGTVILDVASWPKSDGLFATSYQCFVLEAPADSVWSLRATTLSPLQTVTISFLGDMDCGAGRTISPVDKKFAFPVKSGGGAYLVHISALGKTDPVTLTVTQVPPAEQEQMAANIVTLPKGPVKIAAAPPVAAEEQLPPQPASASIVSVAFAEAAPAGSTIQDCADGCPEMVALPAGRFSMGSSSVEAGRLANEGPRHDVIFAQSFAIGRREVTFAEWDVCVAAGGCPDGLSDNGWGRGRRPVINVSWEAATAYTAWLSAKTGERYFLPSEAEWEYAARAGTATPWHTGEQIIADDANILNQFQQTVPVASFPANSFGLFDMHGNAAEWTQDCEDIGYFGVPLDGGVAVSSKCDQRMVRGGSFDSVELDVRSARRIPVAREMAQPTIGFRVARAIRPPQQALPNVSLAAAAPATAAPSEIAAAAPASVALTTPQPVSAPAPTQIAAASPVVAAAPAPAAPVPSPAPVVTPAPAPTQIAAAPVAKAAPSPAAVPVAVPVPSPAPSVAVATPTIASTTAAPAKVTPTVAPVPEPAKTPVAPVSPSVPTPAPAKPAPVPAAVQVAATPAPKPAPVPAPAPAPIAAAVKAPVPTFVAPPAGPSAAQLTTIKQVRDLRKQGLEFIQRGEVDKAIARLTQASKLAKGTDLAELLSLDLARARKIKDGLKK